jgi:hypothetical protein
MIGPDAFPTQDTFAQISDNKRVCLFQGFIIGHGIQLGFTNAELGRQMTQLATVALAADHTRLGMFGYHQSDDIFAVLFYTRRVCLDGHIGGDRRYTGCHDPAGFFILHQAKAAGAERFKIMVVAQPGYFYPMLLGGV